MNRLASILYPGLADADAKREMAYYAKVEGKRSPMQGKVASDAASREQASGRGKKPEERKWTSPRWWDEK